MFVGAVADNFGEKIDQKIFHAQIVVDNEAVARETAAYVPIPEITAFRDENGKDCMERIVMENYERIREEVNRIIQKELKRIEADPKLKHLIPQPKGATVAK